jgi:hypothetical protein
MVNFYDKKGNFIFDMGYLKKSIFMLPFAHDSSQ